jgi:hypothetical protein
LNWPASLVRFDHVARIIINANHGAMSSAEKLCVSDRVADCVWFSYHSRPNGRASEIRLTSR